MTHNEATEAVTGQVKLGIGQAGTQTPGFEIITKVVDLLVQRETSIVEVGRSRTPCHTDDIDKVNLKMFDEVSIHFEEERARTSVAMHKDERGLVFRPCIYTEANCVHHNIVATNFAYNLVLLND